MRLLLSALTFALIATVATSAATDDHPEKSAELTCSSADCGLPGIETATLLTNLNAAIMDEGNRGSKKVYFVPENVVLAAISNRSRRCFLSTAKRRYRQAKSARQAGKIPARPLAALELIGASAAPPNGAVVPPQKEIRIEDLDFVATLFDSELFPPVAVAVKVRRGARSVKGFEVDTDLAKEVKAVLESLSKKLDSEKTSSKQSQGLAARLTHGPLFVNVAFEDDDDQAKNDKSCAAFGAGKSLKAHPNLEAWFESLCTMKARQPITLNPQPQMIPFGGAHGLPQLPIVQFDRAKPACLLSLELDLPRVTTSLYSQLKLRLDSSALGKWADYAPKQISCSDTKGKLPTVWPQLRVPKVNCDVRVNESGTSIEWTLSRDLVRSDGDVEQRFGVFFAPSKTEGIQAQLLLSGLLDDPPDHKGIFGGRPSVTPLSRWILHGECK